MLPVNKSQKTVVKAAETKEKYAIERKVRNCYNRLLYRPLIYDIVNDGPLMECTVGENPIWKENT